MKIQIFVFVLGLASVAFAKHQDIHFKCVSQLPTTSFMAKTEGDELVLTTIHHNGTAFMPIHDGIVVPHDLAYLSEVSNILTTMGEQNDFRFPLKKCSIDGPGQLDCFGGGSQSFQGRQMEALNLYTSKLRESAFGKNFDQVKVTLSIYVHDYAPVQDIVMKYETNECELSF
jgi:hypothetical protein